tara:strand:+ start:4850 stop:5533 length:684 start_codon:yes stop_codon:yes gene_type:complete
MALIKWGLVITDGRGKIGGQVLTKGRSGAVIRNKVTPTNPNTARQSAVRAVLTQFSQGWKALTQAQRDAWNAAVGSFTRTNIFGSTYSPSGKNLYTALNTNLTKVGYTAITIPPIPSATVAPGIEDFVLNVGDETLTFLVNEGSASQKLFVQASPPVSPGITNISSKLRLIKVTTQVAATDVDIWAEYVAAYGTPTAGTKIFIKVTAIKDVTGQSTTPEIISGIVVA